MTVEGATCPGCVLRGFDRETRGEDEGRAFTGRALERQVAAHELRQPAADRQSEPGAAVLAGGGAIRLREGLEQLALLLPGNADPGVTHGHAERGMARRVVGNGRGLDAQLDLALVR